MKTAIIKTEIWKDKKIRNLNIDTKLVYFCIITNPERNTTRFFKLDEDYLCIQSGIDYRQLAIVKKQLEENGLVYFKDDWVILSDDSYVAPAKGKLTLSIYNKDLESVPDEVLNYKDNFLLSDSCVTQEYNNKDNNINKDKDINKKPAKQKEVKIKPDFSNQDRIIHYFYNKVAPATGFGARLSKSARESASLMLEQYTETEVCSAVDKLLDMCSSGQESLKYVSRFEGFANKIQVYAGIPKPKVKVPTFDYLSSQEYSSLDNLEKELYWLYYKHVYGDEKFNEMCGMVDENFLYGGLPENAKIIAQARLDLDRLTKG